ncbi:MAG: SurA N-terminal domain-containing protein [Bacteroidales bacterium]|nr:SurA N-terminal domain-containing protein [Bacteroidales bacterium]
MAAIGKIRQHYGILVIIIGLALLAFVLGDLMKTPSRNRNNEVAVVNGEDITYKDFENRAQQVITYQKNMRGGLTRDEEFSLRKQVLDDMIRKIIMEEEYNKLGLAVAKDEVTDLFLGENPNQYVVQNFSDANGNFLRDEVANTIASFNEMTPEAQDMWLNFENFVIEDRMAEKYNSLLKHGYYLPKKMADRYNDNKNLKRSADVYAVRYTTIPDSTVVVTESDKKEFYNTYYKKYPTDATRGIDYVIFEVKPSAADKEAAKKFIEDLTAEFKTTDNVAGFVNYNSDTDAPFDDTWMKASELPVELEDAVAKNEVGFVYGPYEYEGAYNAARILGKEKRNDTLWAQVAVVKREITASTDTDRAVFAEVNKFVTENKTEEQFDNAIETLGLNKRTNQSIRKTTSNIAGIGNARDLVRWTFSDDVKVGDLSKVFAYENMYVVAVLTKIVPEGYAPYEELVSGHATQIMKEKKGKMIAEKAKAYGTDYQKMIDALGGEFLTVDNITYDGRGFGGLGVEEKIGGTALGIKEGVYSEPIEGGNAFAIVKATKTTPAGETDYATFQRDKKAQYTNHIVNGAYNALLESAKVENNGILFF